MQLAMYIGNEFIGSTSVIKQKIPQPGYVSGLKRRLIQEHNEIFQCMTIEPEFLLLNPSRPFSVVPADQNNERLVDIDE